MHKHLLKLLDEVCTHAILAQGIWLTEVSQILSVQNATLGPNYLNPTQNSKPTYAYIWPLQCFGTLHLSYNHEQHLKWLKSNCQMNGVNLNWYQIKSQGKRSIFSHWIGWGAPPQPAVSLSSMPWCQMQGSACSVYDSANSSHQKNIQRSPTLSAKPPIRLEPLDDWPHDWRFGTNNLKLDFRLWLTVFFALSSLRLTHTMAHGHGIG